MIVTALALTLSAQTSSVVPADADVWEWDSKTPICSLKQKPAPSGETVQIERTPGNDGTELKITLPAGFKIHKGHFLDAAIDTTPGSTFLADISIGVTKDGQPELYVDLPDPRLINNLAGTASIKVSHPKIGTLDVPIHVATAVITTLRDCENETMRDWGIDPVAWRSLKSRPLPLNHIRERFSALDYPREALAANVEADAVIKLDVTADGTVRACSTAIPSLPEGFETASCRVLTGAKFQPALDTNGKPAPAPIVFDVRFRIDN